MNSVQRRFRVKAGNLFAARELNDTVSLLCRNTHSHLIKHETSWRVQINHTGGRFVICPAGIILSIIISDFYLGGYRTHSAFMSVFSKMMLNVY